MYEKIEKPKENKSRVIANSVKQNTSDNSPNCGFFDNRPRAFDIGKVNMGLNSSSSLSPIQYAKKKGKQQAGMPAKSKPGTKEKQQSKKQRTFNAFQSYRSNFFSDYNVTVSQVGQYLEEGNKLHGHGSSSSGKGSGENQATKDDADAFVGWWRRKYGSGN